MKKLKERWNVTSKFQIIVIFFVFSITGSASIFISRPIIKYVGITKENLPIALYWILFILISFISYQIMLVLFGWLFGQFDFFWKMEKKMLKRLGLKQFLKEE
jgi:hypothetical protein